MKYFLNSKNYIQLKNVCKLHKYNGENEDKNIFSLKK